MKMLEKMPPIIVICILGPLLLDIISLYPLKHATNILRHTFL